MIEIREYLTSAGKSPFAEWLQSMRNHETCGRIMARLNRVRLGNFGDCEPVGQGVFELRMSFGPGYRIYFTYLSRTAILLLCGGSKKTQARDIETARNYWSDYRSQHHVQEP